MKPLFTFILGALLMVAIGVFAQSSGVTIFKPAVPKKVMVKHYNNPEIVKGIQSEMEKGWIIKMCSYDRSEAIVVYEKY